VLLGEAVTGKQREPNVFVYFNAFQLYRAAGGSFETGDRVLQVWPDGRTGPWLAFELTVVERDAVGRLYHWLTAIDEGPAVRSTRMIETLDEPASPDS
jgi:hypothetical protein